MLRWVVHLEDGPERLSHAAVVAGVELYSFEAICFRRDYCGCRQPFDVNVFNTVSLRWRKLPRAAEAGGAPPPGGRGERHLEAPCAVLMEDTVYIWRGKPHGNALYAFAVDAPHAWSEHRLSGSVPEAMEGYSACAAGRVLYVHGGWDLLTGHTNATYRLDTTTMVWSMVSTRGGAPPPASSHHSATLMGSRMLVFGGLGGYRGHRIYNYVRVLDTQSDRWLSSSGSGGGQPCGGRPLPLPLLLPEGRWSHSAFAYNGELFVFGGRNSYASPCFNDLWRFHPETGAWREAEPRGKGPRWITEMCCCPALGGGGAGGGAGDRVVLFGGRTLVLPPNPLCDSYSVDDLYILDLSPSLKTLCKLAVLQSGLRRNGLPHNVRWELAAMTMTPADEQQEGEELWPAAAAAGQPTANTTLSVLTTAITLNFIAVVFCTLLYTMLRVPWSKVAPQRV